MFRETRGYYSDWIESDTITVSEAADYVYKASGIYGELSTLGDYI